VVSYDDEIDTYVDKVIILKISLINSLLLKKIKDKDILIIVDNKELENFTF
jgi:hypothetical protein